MPDDDASDIEKLHRELFGDVPAKHGTAYERIAAVVMAVLGWDDVEYDRTERPAGLLASHQIDVRCRRPDGTDERLIIECKDMGTSKVDQNVLLKLVAVQDRLAAENAAVITTTDFTRGASEVAVDHDIALIRLRPYDAARDDDTWVRAVDIEMRFGFPVQTDIELLTDHGFVPAAEAHVRAESWMEVRNPDRRTSMTVADLFVQGHVIDRKGEDVVKKELKLDEAVEIEAASGWVRIKGARWTEKTSWTTQRMRREASGDPRLVLQQIDGDGAVFAGRVIVTSKLEAWEIDDVAHTVRLRRLP